MAIEYQVGDDLSDSKFINEPGNYHLMIVRIGDPPTLANGALNSDAYLDIYVEVLAANVPGAEQKSAKLTLYPPKPSHRDGGKFARKIIDRFYRATGLIGDADTGKLITIDHQKLLDARHFLAKIDINEKGYPNLSGADIYHPDDAAVSGVAWPKSAKAMAIPGAWRRSKPAAPPVAALPVASAVATPPVPVDASSL